MNNFEILNLINTHIYEVIFSALVSLVTIFWKKLNLIPKKDACFFKKAGVQPWQINISFTRINFWKAKKLTKKVKAGYFFMMTVMLTLFIFFAYFAFESIVSQPNQWAALKLIKTNEQFLLTYDKAKNFNNEKPWELTPDTCHTKTYQTLSKEKGISHALVYSICTSIGMIGEKNKIEKRIYNTQKQKYLSLSLAIIGMLYFGYFMLALASEINIYSKISKYMDAYN